ncbi:MAG: hypothetical protein F6J98_05380 [Moorea sp. SIO4G2]|nr:hypothetical protein [Moorena sp. SIO4G2]
MGETTPVAHGGDPQDRTGSPRPRCIARRIKFATGRTAPYPTNLLSLNPTRYYCSNGLAPGWP